MNNGLVVCNNDLSPCNTVFKNNEPVAIIDWDGADYGERWEDLTYVLWLWINIGSHQRDKIEILGQMKEALDAYGTVFKIVLLETGFYLTFLFNNAIFDATFYGLGKTEYMLTQSLCIDAVYYGVMFILYLTGVFVPSLWGIALMFGIGMALDFIPALLLHLHVLKKENIEIDFKLLPKE